ncbi:MAG: serine hydrolase domain-containing protein [Flammeovirgaceae bacterium]
MKIQKFLDEATSDKLTGVVVYISTPKRGEWIGVSGYSNLKDKIPMQKDDIFSMGSVGKMYNAVAVMKLVQEGRIKLDDKISNYLPKEIIDNIPKAKDVTLKNLLGHTSGFINYEHNSELNSLYLTGRLKLDTLSRYEVLKKYVFGKASLFNPGAKYDYCSTNYLLLAMIVDKIVPEGHSDYLRKLIAEHGFAKTYYLQTPKHKNVSYYGDLDKDGIVEDLTNQTFETTNWLTGDDGVYAPIEEAAHFLQSLMKGKILNQQSLKEMMTWNNDKKPDYGLGLMADKSFPYRFLLGHSGRGIGTTTDLYYFPKQDITVAIFCNNGLRAAAPTFKKEYNKMRAKIVKKLFLF